MLVAERYILRRVLALSLTTLIAATVIVLLTQVLGRVNVIANSGAALLTFATMAAMLVPSMVNIVMPFALLLGAGQTLNTMHNDSEIVVLEAAGASGMVVARPILLLAGAMSLVTLASMLIVEPAANRVLRDTINTASSSFVRFAVQSGEFHRVEDQLYIQVAQQTPAGDFEGIVIADMRDPAGELIYHARRGAIREHEGLDVLLMSGGEIHRKNAFTGDVSIITFQSYMLDFSQFGPNAAAGGYSPKERATAFLVDPDPDDRYFQQRPYRLREELHRRFSEWLYPLAFGLIAIYYCAGARSNREERLWGIAGALAVALVVRGAGFVAVGNSGRSAAWAAAAYILPLGAVGLFGGLMLAGRQARISQAWMERMARYWATAGRLYAARPTLRRGRRQGGTA